MVSDMKAMVYIRNEIIVTKASSMGTRLIWISWGWECLRVEGRFSIWVQVLFFGRVSDLAGGKQIKKFHTVLVDV